eukprot:TRINITY_DN15018_c0_g1_i1.p1 TRINITY_DN15018_c0_g1~~TRINITY_DN15018_c0_g1_i1.p1  ORF type:complete len:477 (-),score=106.71 TRINITY_DN15018_c0_g1_i1:52-1482(-)
MWKIVTRSNVNVNKQSVSSFKTIGKVSRSLEGKKVTHFHNGNKNNSIQWNHSMELGMQKKEWKRSYSIERGVNYLERLLSKDVSRKEILSDFRGKVLSLAKTEEGSEAIVDIVNLRDEKYVSDYSEEIIDIVLHEIKGKSVELLTFANSSRLLPVLVEQLPDRMDYIWKELERNLDTILLNEKLVEPLADVLYSSYESVAHNTLKLMNSKNGREVVELVSSDPKNAVEIIKSLQGKIADFSSDPETGPIVVRTLYALPQEKYSLVWKEINATPQVFDRILHSDYGIYIIKRLMGVDIRPIIKRMIELIEKDRYGQILFLSENNYVNRAIMRELRGKLVDHSRSEPIVEVAKSLIERLPREDSHSFWEEVLESKESLKKASSSSTGKELVRKMLNKDFKEFFSQNVAPSTIDDVVEKMDLEGFIQTVLKRATDIGAKEDLITVWNAVIESHSLFEQLHYWAQNFDKAPIAKGNQKEI